MSKPCSDGMMSRGDGIPWDLPASPAESGPSARSQVGMPAPQRGRLHLLAALVTLPLLPACSRDPGHGPGKVHWDRDTCARCGMAVSDRHYAAQVRGGPKREVFKFDDIGCALFWLKEQPWADAAETEIWVNDFRGGEWLDARKAHYLPGKTTPMAYGFGALAQSEAGSVDFTAMKADILARGK